MRAPARMLPAATTIAVLACAWWVPRVVASAETSRRTSRSTGVATLRGSVPGMPLSSASVTTPSTVPPPIASTVPVPTSTSDSSDYLGDFPDPYVLPDGGGYYAYATNTGSENVPLLHSDDLVHWTKLGDALPQLPTWAASSNHSVWAPSVTRASGRYIMYVSIVDEQRQVHCVFVATADRAAGPFTVGDSLICDTGAIDASPFRSADGALWLTWKYEASGAQPQRIASHNSPPTAYTSSEHRQHSSPPRRTGRAASSKAHR